MENKLGHLFLSPFPPEMWFCPIDCPSSLNVWNFLQVLESGYVQSFLKERAIKWAMKFCCFYKATCIFGKMWEPRIYFWVLWSSLSPLWIFWGQKKIITLFNLVLDHLALWFSMICSLVDFSLPWWVGGLGLFFPIALADLLELCVLLGTPLHSRGRHRLAARTLSSFHVVSWWWVVVNTLH